MVDGRAVALPAPQGVVGGVLVALGKRGVVEDAVDKRLDGAAEGDDHVADVDELRGHLADEVDAQQLAAVWA